MLIYNSYALETVHINGEVSESIPVVPYRGVSNSSIHATPKTGKAKPKVVHFKIEEEQDSDDYIPINMISESYVDSGKKHMQ